MARNPSPSRIADPPSTQPGRAASLPTTSRLAVPPRSAPGSDPRRRSSAMLRPAPRPLRSLRCGEEEFDVPQAVDDAGRTASGVGLESPPDHAGGVRGAKFPRPGREHPCSGAWASSATTSFWKAPRAEGEVPISPRGTGGGGNSGKQPLRIGGKEESRNREMGGELGGNRR